MKRFGDDDDDDARKPPLPPTSVIKDGSENSEQSSVSELTLEKGLLRSPGNDSANANDAVVPIESLLHHSEDDRSKDEDVIGTTAAMDVSRDSSAIAGASSAVPSSHQASEEEEDDNDDDDFDDDDDDDHHDSTQPTGPTARSSVVSSVNQSTVNDQPRLTIPIASFVPQNAEQDNTREPNDANKDTKSTDDDVFWTNPRLYTLLCVLVTIILAGTVVAIMFVLGVVGGSSTPNENQSPDNGGVGLDLEGPTPAPTEPPTASPTTPPTAAPVSTTIPTTAAPITRAPIVPAAPTPDASPASPAAPQNPLPSQQPAQENVFVALEELLVSIAFDGGTALQTPGTPQNQAFQWLLGLTNLGSLGPSDIVARYGLATFYFATGGESWKVNTGWLQDPDICKWYPEKIGEDFSCDANGNKVAIVLPENDLKGTLPVELAHLTNMGKSTWCCGCFRECTVMANGWTSVGLSLEQYGAL